MDRLAPVQRRILTSDNSTLCLNIRRITVSWMYQKASRPSKHVGRQNITVAICASGTRKSRILLTAVSAPSLSSTAARIVDVAAILDDLVAKSPEKVDRRLDETCSHRHHSVLS